MQAIELSAIQTQTVLRRLPSFELSYEIFTHMKVYPEYSIAIAIPFGKKCYVYFSFNETTDVCYLMEIKESKNDAYSRKVNRITIVSTDIPHALAIGTLFYGTLVTSEDAGSFFVIEDILQYRGFVLGNTPFSNKVQYIDEFFRTQMTEMSLSEKMSSLRFALPYMWEVSNPDEASLLSHHESIKATLLYTTRYIQLRKWGDISPHLNIYPNKLSMQSAEKQVKRNDQPGTNANTATAEYRTSLTQTHVSTNASTHASTHIPNVVFDYKKPQYKYSCVFVVRADIQYDIYHLYACGKNGESVYCCIAGIPTLKTSVFMNSLFRNIKENQNIDLIEESDDEEENEFDGNCNYNGNAKSIDKYVDLDKSLHMECAFNFKFKKWVPIRVASENSRVVHISKL